MGGKRGLLLLLALLGAGSGDAQELKPFTSGSYREIVNDRAGRSFLLVFWSIDCPPCYAELKMLGEVWRERRFDLVLVAADSTSAAGPVRERLANWGLADSEAWLFAAPAERLRFEVDRTWYGELPRSYLFDADHRRHTISGRLEEARVRRWLEGDPP